MENQSLSPTLAAPPCGRSHDLSRVGEPFTAQEPWLLKPLDELVWADFPEDKALRGRAIIILSLREMPYEAYLRTAHWREVRHRAMKAANWLCTCSERAVDVHHNSYEHLGFEYPGDVIAFCRPCHIRFHDTWTLRIRYELNRHLNPAA
jgi:hypothetical protein